MKLLMTVTLILCYLVIVSIGIAETSSISSLKPSSPVLSKSPRLFKKRHISHFPQTELSRKAMHLRIGMTREEVLVLLGRPTWAQSYKGIPLDWSWRNGFCNPVDVTFDEGLRVNGFNQGRAICLVATYEDVPDDENLCSNPKVAPLCDLKFQFKKKQIFDQNRNYRSLSISLR